MQPPDSWFSYITVKVCSGVLLRVHTVLHHRFGDRAGHGKGREGKEVGEYHGDVRIVGTL